MKYPKSDWELFKKKIPVWQEQYVTQLNKVYIDILSQNKSALENFWELDKCIKNDKKCLGVRINMSSTDMYCDIVTLLRQGVINFTDLAEFSSKLQDDVKNAIVSIICK